MFKMTLGTVRMWAEKKFSRKISGPKLHVFWILLRDWTSIWRGRRFNVDRIMKSKHQLTSVQVFQSGGRSGNWNQNNLIKSPLNVNYCHAIDCIIVDWHYFCPHLPANFVERKKPYTQWWSRRNDLKKIFVSIW